MYTINQPVQSKAGKLSWSNNYGIETLHESVSV